MHRALFELVSKVKLVRVTKGPTERAFLSRRIDYFPRARDAFGWLLGSLDLEGSDEVLVPDYIGWSPREGSGVFDPIEELGIRPTFYPLDRRLHVKTEILSDLLTSGRYRLLLLIHYFGYPDPNYGEIVALAESAGVRVIEDEAHALLTDLVGGISGRRAYASIGSIHKLFPTQGGGVLLCDDVAGKPDLPLSRAPVASSLTSFDLALVAKRRVVNCQFLLSRLASFPADQVDLLRGTIPTGVVPQTLPILLMNADRDAVYRDLNQRGFGVVSLYHTLIDAVPKETHPDAHWVSRRVLNLPVHQDTNPEILVELVDNLQQSLESFSP